MVNSLVVVGWLVLLLHHLLLLDLYWHLTVVLHEDLIHVTHLLLLLDHEKLLLLLLIEDVNAAVLSCSSWDSSREVSKLVELIEVLCSLQENLLIVVKIIIRINISISEKVAVLLKISYLVVKIDELLCLLLNKKGSFCNIELHDGFLLLVDILEVSHLVPISLKRVGSSFLECQTIIGKGRRSLDSVG